MSTTRRYTIASNRAVLSSTVKVKTKKVGEECVVVETRMLNISPPCLGRKPSKIILVYDEDEDEVKTVSIYTHGESYGARNICVSSVKLQGIIARTIQERGLSEYICCLSANSVFGDGGEPPDQSRFFYFYQPRYDAEKSCKRRVLLVESKGLVHQSTSVGTRRLTCVASGCLFKVNVVGEIGDDEGTVNYVYNGRNFGLKPRLEQFLAGFSIPFPEPVLELMKFQNLFSVTTEDKAIALAHFGDHISRSFSSPDIWSMIQKAAVLGELELMGNLCKTLAARLNRVMEDGVVAAEVELGV